MWIDEIHSTSSLTPMAAHKQSGVGVENGMLGLLEYIVPQAYYRRIDVCAGRLAALHITNTASARNKSVSDSVGGLSESNLNCPPTNDKTGI